MDWMERPLFRRNHLAVKFLQIVGLSVLWLLGSVSVVGLVWVSIGAYGCAVQVIRRGQGKLLPWFWRCLRRSWKVGVVGAALGLLGLFLVFCVRFSSLLGAEHWGWAVLSYVYFFLLLLLLLYFCFLAPVACRFQPAPGKALKLAAVLLLRHLLTAVTSLLVFYLAFWLILRLPGLGLVLPGGALYLWASVLEGVFQKEALESGPFWEEAA